MENLNPHRLLSAGLPSEPSSLAGQSGSSASSAISDGESFSNEKIKKLLLADRREDIILGLLPLAKRIGRKSRDEYSVAVECVVECVNRLENLEHTQYIQYIAKCIRGKVQTHRASLSVVPVPQWWYRLLKSLNREEELKYQYIDYQNTEMLKEYMYSDIVEIIESKLNRVELHVLHAKMCGFTEEEIGSELGYTRQYIQQIKDQLMEKLRKILRELA